ncbi:MAG: glycosyltransferase family 4 protein [Parasphingopyxis sp.]|uniref:glycosyltransferase family 4 protein n=1 Tax=Parasphingopyxis sp. TaxID=1920299 RepID=UPI003FA02FA0
MQKDLFDVRSFPSLEKFSAGGSDKRLQVLIATEEIIGPVRNGGIASTYYHLARGLVADGHRVTVLYLKGRKVENETPEHWVDHYAGLGIDLVYLPDLDEEIACASTKWQWRWLSFYRWLRANDRFDMVHTSEWRGGAFYCLQAKRLGLAFQDTLFVMKTSSPYIWNRHYQMRPIDKPELVVAAFAEQKCVEWADMVVGGSAHLLSFMDHIGYRLPEGRTFVQPNIVDFSEVKVEDRRPARVQGDLVETRELVFFGRLEPRKGLELFVFAIDALVARGVEIEKITFLGKEGEKLQSQGNQKPIAFISAHAQHWPFPVEIVSDRNQPEALSLMCSRDMIAVMPSLIENSTMAVYEALVHHIPFIATDVGGTPELIDPADHPTTLVRPEVQHLADRLADALENGHRIARPAFDNDHNLETWYGFHRHIAENGHHALAPRPAAHPGLESIAYVAMPPNQHALAALVQGRPTAILSDADHVIMVTFLPTPAVREQIDAARNKGYTVIEMIGASAGECFNRAREDIGSDILVFDAAGAMNLSPEFFPMVRKALAAQPADFLTSLYHIRAVDMDDDALFVPLGADVATQALSGNAYGVELLIGTRMAFDATGPFEGYRVSSGTLHEYVGRAAADGRELFVIPEPLFDVHMGQDMMGTGNPTCSYLIRKPVLEDMSLAARKLLLIDSDRIGGGGQKPNSGPLIMAKAHRAPDGVAWLTNVERLGHVNDKVLHNHAIFLGFDRLTGVLHVAKRHTGELIVKANNEIIRHEPDYDTLGELVISDIELLPFLDRQPKTHLRIELITDDQVRAAGLAVQRLEPSVYYLSSHRPIYWGDDFFFMLEQVEKRRAEKLHEQSRADMASSPEPDDHDRRGTSTAPTGAASDLRQSGVLRRLRDKIGF